MSITIEQYVDIERPIEVVWAYVVDHDEWRGPVVYKVQKLTTGPHGVGAHYKDYYRINALIKGSVVFEITAFEPPYHLAWTQPEVTRPLTVLDGHYRLARHNGGTRFTLQVTYEPIGAWRLATPLMRRDFEQRTFPHLLKQLKRNVEATA